MSLTNEPGKADYPKLLNSRQLRRWLFGYQLQRGGYPDPRLLDTEIHRSYGFESNAPAVTPAAYRYYWMFWWQQELRNAIGMPMEQLTDLVESVTTGLNDVQRKRQPNGKRFSRYEIGTAATIAGIGVLVAGIIFWPRKQPKPPTLNQRIQRSVPAEALKAAWRFARRG